MKTADLMLASGLNRGEFSDPVLEHVGIGVDTYSVRLEKAVREFGRAGDRVSFPIHRKDTNRGQG